MPKYVLLLPRAEGGLFMSEKGNSKAILCIVIAIIVVIALVIGGYFLLRNKDDFLALDIQVETKN